MSVSVSWHEVGFEIDTRWHQLQRLWVDGHLFGGPATNAEVAAEIEKIIADLEGVVQRLEANEIGDWLDE